MSSTSLPKTALLLGCCLVITVVLAVKNAPSLKSPIALAQPRLVKLAKASQTRSERPTLLWQKSEIRPVESVAFSPDGRLLASAMRQGEMQLRARHAIKLWDVQSGDLKSTFVFTNGDLNKIEFSPDGKWLAGCDGRRLVIWNVQNEKIVREWIKPRGWVGTMVFSPDGKSLACGGYDTVRLMDVFSGKEKRSIKVPDKRKHSSLDYYYVDDLAFAPDGKSLSIAYRYAGVVGLWNLSSGQLQLITYNNRGDRFFTPTFHEVAFTPDGQSLLTAGGAAVFNDVREPPDQGFILLWSPQKAAKNKPQKVFKGHHFFVLCLTVTPDGKTIVSGGDEGSVLLHDVPSGKVRHVLWGREGKGTGNWQRDINEVAVSPDGSLIAACDVRGFVKLWRL